MSQSLQREQPHHFGAGPALLPTSVLQQAAFDLVNYQNSGLGLGEISHRSKPAIKVIDDCKAHLKELLDIPPTHEVFFLQGGGTSGFSSIATNLTAAFAKKTGKKGRAGYVITGTWSKKASQEAERLGIDVDVVVDSKKTQGKFGDIPPTSEWSIPKDLASTSYVYYCDNETVNGVEFSEFPFDSFPKTEIVADMSSNFLSKKIDVSKYGCIMAGAQKNVGLAGVTIYIVKKSLLDQASDEELNRLNVPLSPIAFHYPTAVENNSAYNTIPIFTLHIVDLVLQRLLRNGGLPHQEALNVAKAEKLYKVLDSYPELFNLPVAQKVRSKMNVVFTINGDGKENDFLQGAEKKGLTGLKGHRSVGGMRASLYNAVSMESVDLLVDYINEFARK